MEEKNKEEKQEKKELNRNILHDQDITCKKSENTINISSKLKIIQELDNILLEEYIKKSFHLNTSQKSYSANFERTCLYDNPLDLEKNVEVTNEHIISYKLYQLYIFIITFINKYNIYIFFLIIFILLLNNYFIKPT